MRLSQLQPRVTHQEPAPLQHNYLPKPLAAQENKGLFSSDEESTSTSECPYKQEESSCWSPKLYRAIYCSGDRGQRVLTIKNSSQAVKGQALAHQCIKFTNFGGLGTEK